MPLFLGKDGKQRAVEANAGIDRTVPTLYFGLLTTYPSGAESMTLATLVGGSGGTEHVDAGPAEGAAGCWYAGGRKVIEFGAYSALICSSDNGLNQWLNKTGVTKSVGGLFIATVQSGTSGEILWVGYPDVGTIPVYNDRGVKWDDTLIDLKVS